MENDFLFLHSGISPFDCGYQRSRNKYFLNYAGEKRMPLLQNMSKGFLSIKEAKKWLKENEMGLTVQYNMRYLIKFNEEPDFFCIVDLNNITVKL